MTMAINSKNNYSEFGTFKRITKSSKSKPQGKINVLSNIDKLHEFYDEKGLEFDEDTFKNILKE